MWAAVPDDAILAVGGRLDVPRLLAGVEAFLPPDGKAGLKKAIEEGLAPVVGRDKLPAVLAGLGPDWAVWATAPVKTSGAFLPEWTAALKLSDGKGGVDVGRTVLQAVDFAAQMARFAYNREHADQIELTEESKDGITVKVLSNEKGFPAGLRPSYAAQGRLPRRGQFAGCGASVQPADRTASRSEGAAGTRFSAKHLRGYLETHRGAIVEAAARWSGKPAKEIEHDLTELSAVLEAFDKVELRHTIGDGKVRLSLHVEFVEAADQVGHAPRDAIGRCHAVRDLHPRQRDPPALPWPVIGRLRAPAAARPAPALPAAPNHVRHADRDR